jgi:hypothetical protein
LGRGRFCKIITYLSTLLVPSATICAAAAHTLPPHTHTPPPRTHCRHTHARRRRAHIAATHTHTPPPHTHCPKPRVVSDKVILEGLRLLDLDGLKESSRGVLLAHMSRGSRQGVE